ncbi:ATP-binding protein [Pedobacter sp. Du54]|uniref:ATP-binding protein n=1 Tax=Pedobacter anseongensis TaxID=3133439 RepID=UPI0030AC973E
MHVNVQKYRVLGTLNLILLLLVFYSCAKHFESGSRLRVSTILCLIVFVGILCYLFKIYKDEYALVRSYLKEKKVAEANADRLMNLSHEIRTPLNSIIGFSEQLVQTKLDEHQAQQLNAVRSSSILLLDLVNDILDFSKCETGKINFEKLPFVPLDALNEVVNNIVIQASQKNVVLKTQILFNEAICFCGDPLRLKQVVINLLSNAIKFTQKGSVTLKADVVLISKNQGLLNVRIIDTGIGIGYKDLDSIFNEFTQVSNLSTQVQHKGTGLGLAICKKIVEFQGGEINVTSELGKGSTFSFSIPYQICDEKYQESKNTISINLSNLIGKRILIADDNKINTLLVKTVLNKYQMIIDSVKDGEEALVMFEENKYDLLLTDIQMPKMNGVALSKSVRLHHDETKRTIPIIGVTANVFAKHSKLYLDAGMNELILKPFTENELTQKIAAQINL